MQKFKWVLIEIMPMLVSVLVGSAAMDLLDIQFHILVVHKPTFLQQFSHWLIWLLVVLGCSVVLRFIRFIVVSWREARVWHYQHTYRKAIEDKKNNIGL